MYRVGLVFLLLCFCQISKAEIELSPKIVFDLLSSRIDHVLYETKNLKSELAETKTVVEGIEKKIEQIGADVSLIGNKVDKFEGEQSLLNENVKTISDASKAMIKSDVKSQSLILRKMLINEKTHMRNTVKKFENKMKAFESDIKNQLTLINVSVESAFDNFNDSITGQKITTTDSLMSFENKMTTSVKETGIIIQEMYEDFERKLGDSEAKVSQRISTIDANLQSAKREFNGRLNSADRQLRSISSKQEIEKDTFSDQISALSKRIAVEEVRKVAFSAKLQTKKSSYGKNERIVFNQVLYSHGGGYSSSTGIFTAPKSGTYIFTFNVQPSYGKKAHILLILNRKLLTTAIAESNDMEVSGGNVGIAYVVAGEKVWIETANLNDKYYIWPYRTTFNGILID